MHNALKIQEILSIIFGHCCPSVIPVLVRTCGVFKEPALDVLWEELDDLSPLEQFLPEACHQSCQDRCSFGRPLTQTEWTTLRNYTRRIRSIKNFQNGLDVMHLRILSNPPATDPLFPRLRSLCGEYKTTSMHLLHLPFPSLVSFDVHFTDPNCIRDSLDLFPLSSPSIKRFSLSVDLSDVAFDKFVSTRLGGWPSLEAVLCPEITLDVDALTRLSHMPALTQLAFALSAALPASDSSFLFSNLQNLTLQSQSLQTITWLLSRLRLPVITDLSALVTSCPSKEELSIFLASVQTSGISHTIQGLRLVQSRTDEERDPAPPLLALEDLRSCMTISNLRLLVLHVEWSVVLSSNDLLMLASAWPYLEALTINVDWGWNPVAGGGITPNGLLQLLQICPLLSRVALAIDTRGYTEFLGPPDNLGSIPSRRFSIDVLDSVIEAESVPAIAAYFASIARRFPLSLAAWVSLQMASELPDWDVYYDRWDDVVKRLNDAVSQPS